MPYNSAYCPLSGHQFLVRAHLHEPGAVEHDDQIGHADGGEAVGNEDGDAAAAAAGLLPRAAAA